MRPLLSEKKSIRLEGLPGEFQICNPLGYGSSSVAYHAIYRTASGNRTDYLLKEYNPVYLSMDRDAEGNLVTDQKAQFQEGLEHFKDSYRLQERIARDSTLRNSTPAPEGLYEGLDTLFSITPLYSGSSYESVEDTSLVDTLTTLKALTAVIKEYHCQKYLHLDVKPANLFVLPETREHVILFDFDSVVRIDRLGQGPVQKLRRTLDWCAPELRDPPCLEALCAATDLFSIGEMLFQRIYRRHSLPAERDPHSVYTYPKDSPLLAPHLENGQLLHELTEFFRHTICVLPQDRWQTADHVLAALEKMIHLASRERYLCPTRLSCKSFFVGREPELEQIHETLSAQSKLVLFGMGGIGKSELARQYARQFANCYDTVLFLPYADNWELTLSNDTWFNIAGLTHCKDESVLKYARKKLSALQQLSNDRVLLIIDNLDQDEFTEEETELWDPLENLGCTLLVTSRSVTWERIPKLEVTPLRRESDLLSLFQHHSGITSLDEAQHSAIKKIITFLGRHTMAVELAAKQVRACGLTPAEYLDKLRTHRLDAIGTESVSAAKNGSRAPAADQIRDLFRLADLDRTSQQIMYGMALMPHEGIDRKQFMSWRHLTQLDEINRLCDLSWLTSYDGYIRIHPLVAEAVLLTGSPAEFYNTFLPELGNHLLDLNAVPSVQGTDWDVYLASHAAYMLHRYEVKSDTVARFFGIVSFLLSRSLCYDAAVAYGEHAIKMSMDLEPYSETTAELCRMMAEHYSFSCDLPSALPYWRQEEAIWEKRGIPKGFYQSMAAFFLDLGDLSQAAIYFQKEKDVV